MNTMNLRMVYTYVLIDYVCVFVFAYMWMVCISIPVGI